MSFGLVIKFLLDSSCKEMLLLLTRFIVQGQLMRVGAAAAHEKVSVQ